MTVKTLHSNADDNTGKIPVQLKSENSCALVVDDDTITTYIVSNMVKKLGFSLVVTANDGEEACSKMQQSNFDLVITDLFMPKMNGDELAKRIKQAAPETKIILMTGSNQNQMKSRMEGVNVDHWLFKPINFYQLTALIDDLL